MNKYLHTTFTRLLQSRVARVIVVIVALSVLVHGYEALTRPNIQPSSQSVTGTMPPMVQYDSAPLRTPDLSGDEKTRILAEFPVYGSRSIEQTYLTLPEWYQVYNYNELADFLQRGGRQTDFPWLGSVQNFWDYYGIALEESADEPFNWLYNFVDGVIGVNFTVEYMLTAAYENTIGSITQFIAGSDTEADAFIAHSWDNYAERMYQETWYHYPYYTDVADIWTQTALFDTQFLRNLERKVAFSASYILKGTYAQAWLLVAVQKENETISVVYAEDPAVLQSEGATVLKTLSDGKYLIQTERYAGFKAMLLKLLTHDVQFVEVMGHDTITLSYLSQQEVEPFVDVGGVRILDKRPLFFHVEGYLYRVTLETNVKDLGAVIHSLDTNGAQFEMIYDF